MANYWKSYIGDGVYGELTEHGDVVLTTEDGLRVTNRIVLEPEVYAMLQRFMLRVAEIEMAIAAQRKPPVNKED